MKLHGTMSGTSDEGRDPAIKDLRKSVRRLRILTASLFAVMIVLNLTPAGAEIKAKITGEDVVDESLTGADVQDRSLTGVDVDGGSIDGFNIALDTLVGGHVVDDSLTTLDVQDDSLTGVDVQDGSLFGGELAPSSLNGFHVLDNSLTGSDVQDNSLTSFDLNEEALVSNDAHDFFNPNCDPHSGTFIECGTVTLSIGHTMPVIAFWNYGFTSDIEGDQAQGSCQTRVDGATTGQVFNGTFEDQQPFPFGGEYGATPIVDVMQLGAGTHTVGLWCNESLPDEMDFVVTNLRIAVVELGLDND